MDGITDSEFIVLKAGITEHIKQIERLFDPDCKITFIMRKPGDTECELLIGTDYDLNEIIKVVKRSKDRSAE